MGSNAPYRLPPRGSWQGCDGKTVLYSLRPAALGPLGSTDPFSLKTVHWTVFRALEPSLCEGGFWVVNASYRLPLRGSWLARRQTFGFAGLPKADCDGKIKDFGIAPQARLREFFESNPNSSHPIPTHTDASAGISGASGWPESAAAIARLTKPRGSNCIGLSLRRRERWNQRRERMALKRGSNRIGLSPHRRERWNQRRERMV